METQKLIEHIKRRIEFFQSQLEGISSNNTRGKYRALIHELERVRDLIE